MAFRTTSGRDEQPSRIAAAVFEFQRHEASNGDRNRSVSDKCPHEAPRTSIHVSQVSDSWYQCPDAEIRYHGPNAGIGTLAHRAPFLPSGESTSAVTGEELDSQGSCLARGTDREGYRR